MGESRSLLDDEDRQSFADRFGRDVIQQSWRLYAFCLMGNHYHLLIETPEANLARGMRRLNSVYTQAFNRRHCRVGHALQGRYKAIVVDRDAYLLELCRYVVLNPVRARLVEDPTEWPWSSYAAIAGNAPVPDWVAADAALGLLHSDRVAARRSYVCFVAQGIGRPSPWQNLAGQIFLGDQTFLERMQALAAQRPGNGAFPSTAPAKYQ
jgi:putative transposase